MKKPQTERPAHNADSDQGPGQNVPMSPLERRCDPTSTTTETYQEVDRDGCPIFRFDSDSWVSQTFRLIRLSGFSRETKGLTGDTWRADITS